MTGQQTTKPIIPLSLAQRTRGKTLYFTYNLINAISYANLAETIIVLALLQMGGNAFLTGVATAGLYAALPFMLLGYHTIPRLGVSRTAGMYWGLRSLFAVFMIAAPWAASFWGDFSGRVLLLIGSTGFFVARAAGVVSITGIITEITTERDRGGLIGTSFRLSQGGSFLMTLLIVFFLIGDAPLDRYQWFFGAGLITGLIAALALWFIPESGVFRNLPRFSLREQWRWLVAERGRRWFLAMMVLIPVTNGVTRMFLLLVVKQGYGLSDQQAVIFVMIGMVGGVSASYAYGFFLDKLGSRPLLFLTSLLDLAGVAMVVALPDGLVPWQLGLIFLFNGIGHVSFQASTQHYFISITNRENQLSIGILTQTIGGLTGGAALLLAGGGLGFLQELPAAIESPLLPFRWFFGAHLVLVIFRQFIFYRLPRLRSQGIRDSLNVLFSPWDWRAINAVKQAVGQSSEDQEARALDTILRTAEKGPFQEDIAGFLLSPSWAVRERAMEALSHVRPTTALVDLLLRDLKENQFTTAHWSALWLGRWGAKRAIPPLREAIEGPDILLRAKAIHALVELGDREALPLIKHRFERSPNPAVIIEAARAIALWEGKDGFAIVLDKLGEPMPPQARDELYLSLARMVGHYDDYYRDLMLFRRDPDLYEAEARERFRRDKISTLVDAFFVGTLSRRAMAKELERLSEQFEAWFVTTALDFLRGSDQPSEPAAGILFLLLLSSEQGTHRRQD